MCAFNIIICDHPSNNKMSSVSINYKNRKGQISILLKKKYLSYKKVGDYTIFYKKKSYQSTGNYYYICK